MQDKVCYFQYWKHLCYLIVRCLGNCGPKVVTAIDFVYLAECDFYAPNLLNVHWSLKMKSKGNAYTEFPHISNLIEISFSSRSIIIPKNILIDGTNYILLFNATNGTHSGYQSHKFITSSKPQNISCKVQPEYGWSLNTSFKIIIDSEENSEFTYLIKYKQNSSELWTTKCSGKKRTCNLGRQYAASDHLFLVKSEVINEDGDSSFCYSNFTVKSNPATISIEDFESKSSNFAKTGDFEEFNDISTLLIDIFMNNQVRKTCIYLRQYL